MNTPSRQVGSINGSRIVLCVGGSIAAFKSAALASLLVRQGAEVHPLMTQAASNFIGEATLAGLTGKPVLTGMFEGSVGAELHIELGRRSDLIVIAPATADLIARLAVGRASDLVSTVVLCADCPVLMAPAMHPAMWSHPATQRNVATLLADGRIELVGPVEGQVASGETGLGRMAEPEAVQAAIIARLTPNDLAGRHIVVTAGPTAEDIDPVRFITNRSSGKMGFAIAARAAAHGARVTLIAGPVSLETPHAVERINVRSAETMKEALVQATGAGLTDADAVVMTAAVADFRPAETRHNKIERPQDGSPLLLDLRANADIIGSIGKVRQDHRPLLVGFAMETGDDEAMLERAQRKRARKRLDLVIANQAVDALGGDTTRAAFVSSEPVRWFASGPKTELAEQIVGWVASHLD